MYLVTKEASMPNAKDQQVLNRNILTVGPGGCGKTTQVLTLEKPVFAYLFDGHALDTLQGYDLDYEEFLPDEIPLGVYSLSKKANEAEAARQKKDRDKNLAKRSADLYREWEAHFERSCDNGDFEGVQTIMFDSLTMFGDLVMDEVLRINGRPGQWPNQDDYAPAINAIRNVFRRATSMHKQLYVCAHGMLIEDELAHKVFYQIATFGQLRTKLPLMFGHILPLSAEASSNGKMSYTCQTKPDKYWPGVRTTMRGCQFKEDIEIDWSKDPVGQGLGGLLKRFNAFGNRPNTNAAQAVTEKE